MRQTITVRLDEELAAWLEETSERVGIPQSQIVRSQLEKAKNDANEKPFMRLAGVMRGLPRGLSKRKGFSRS